MAGVLKAMILYAITTKDNGRERHHYTDRKDCLPCDGYAYREFIYDPRVTTWRKVLPAIRQVERDGQFVTWQVGTRFYETPAQGGAEK